MEKCSNTLKFASSVCFPILEGRFSLFLGLSGCWVQAVGLQNALYIYDADSELQGVTDFKIWSFA